jgi:hypothetical protein
MPESQPAVTVHTELAALPSETGVPAGSASPPPAAIDPSAPPSESGVTTAAVRAPASPWILPSEAGVSVGVAP